MVELDLAGAEAGLFECLGQGRRPLALLLGAGCPAAVQVDRAGTLESLIPDIAGMTARVRAEVAGTSKKAALEVLDAALQADLGRPGNVEDMLTRLRTLHTIAGSDVVRGLSITEIDALEAAITEVIAGLVSVELPSSGPTPFDDLALWAGGIQRSEPLNLFTTNYDTLLEQALETREVAFFDGFVGAHRPFLDVWAMDHDDAPSRWVRLWKLHGSVNWTRQDARVFRSTYSGSGAVPLIHPSHLKYDQSRRMPYLLMQDRLRAFLQLPSATVVTTGFSYGDAHLNELLAAGLRGNPTAAIFALLHGDISKYSSALDTAATFPNVTLLARDGGVVAGKSGSWAASAGGGSTHCSLGDFVRFGERLRALAGRTS